MFNVAMTALFLNTLIVLKHSGSRELYSSSICKTSILTDAFDLKILMQTQCSMNDSVFAEK